ncbi:VanZ family protein [Streptomyces sp. NPDC059862]|uniref:VanZ family protein n=1 Tax=Streptomyces sp. NPDC059862 TaxID=3346975 RepID=UPI00365CA6E2
MQRQGSVGGSAAIHMRVTGGVLLVAHLAFVAWFTLRPLDVPWVMPANLRPLAGIRADLALGWSEAARSIGAGLALLAPLGVLLPLAGGRLAVSPLGSLVRTVAAGALISLGIELLQTGVPGQVVDVDSLLLNTAGVALAHIVVVPAGRHWLRRRPESPRRASRRGRPTGPAGVAGAGTPAPGGAVVGRRLHRARLRSSGGTPVASPSSSALRLDAPPRSN